MSNQTTWPKDNASARTAKEIGQRSDEVSFNDVYADAADSFRRYATKRPEVVAMWCFGIGFVVGWKLKPW